MVRWNDQEKEGLRRMYPDRSISIDKLAEVLRKEPSSVRNQASLLGLKRDRISPEELKFLSLDYVYFDDSVGDIARRYDLPVSGISAYVRRAVDEGFVSQEQYDFAKRRRKSFSKSGERNPNFGRNHSLETRAKISKGRVGKLAGADHPQWGKSPSDETREKISRANKGKVRTEEQRIVLADNYQLGLGRMSYEKRRAIGQKSGKLRAESFRRQMYNVDGGFYAASQQEGAVALMLEKYIPSYETKSGETFQVRDRGIDNGGIDFLVDGEFLEWHPIILANKRGDIPSEEENESYRNAVANLSVEERKDFESDYKQVLGVNYRNVRQSAIDNSGYSGANVSLAGDVRGLYDFISRHSNKLPSYEQFNKEFKDFIKYVKGFAVKKSKDKMEAA